MVKKNSSDFKYVNIHSNISNWSVSGRETVFTWGSDIQQIKVSDVLVGSQRCTVSETEEKLDPACAILPARKQGNNCNVFAERNN